MIWHQLSVGILSKKTKLELLGLDTTVYMQNSLYSCIERWPTGQLHCSFLVQSFSEYSNFVTSGVSSFCCFIGSLTWVSLEIKIGKYLFLKCISINGHATTHLVVGKPVLLSLIWDKKTYWYKHNEEFHHGSCIFVLLSTKRWNLDTVELIMSCMDGPASPSCHTG
jgi:hypothetical protein